MKKWLKVTLIVIGSLLMLLVLLSLLAGPIAKKYVEKHSMELCHRVATMDKVRTNLFNGTVTIDNLKVLEENGKETFLSFDKLAVNVTLLKLLSKEVKVSKIYLDGLDAKVIQNGSRFNFSDIIELYTNKPKKDKDDGPSEWAVNLMDIQIHNSSISYNDAQIGSRFGLNNLDLVIPQLYLEGGRSDINLDLDFAEGGNLVLKLLYDIQKGDYNLNVKMKKFNINAVEPYLTKSFNISDFQGFMDGNVSVNGSLQHILNLVASGNVALSKLKVTNENHSPLLSMNTLKLDIGKIDLQKQNYDITNVELDGLDFYYDVYKDGNTLSRISKAKGEQKDTTSRSSAVPNYHVHKFSVSKGRVVYEDHTLLQKMSFPVDDINLTVNDLKSGSTADIRLNAKLGQTGTLSCVGKCDPMNLSNAKVDVDINNLSIKEFSPYAMYYLAYPIEDGLLSFHSKDVIKNNWLNSDNSLDVFKPTFGNKSKDLKPRANIPMKAAMYLITDRKGHVKMDLPVSGDISSPLFSFRKVIWKTFTNLLVKVMLSPVDFVANLGGDNKVFKDMKLPASMPMQLTIEDCHQLNSIADLLKEKDQMNLMISAETPPVTEDNATQNETLKMRSFSLVKDYLVSQGVGADRIRMEEGDKASTKDGNIKLTFNLEIPE
ncbi:MAG: DUF748 domain-containing protein [Bacteroidales bacterium]|nr:DUF748 domain-containing protein [Bacteroidales bacterium]